tara:strand:- start:78 stop:680 length:603 start_codon:yes stop_codon:yes gene_type:complete
MKTHLNINLRSVNTLKFSTNYLPLLPNWNYSLVVSKSNHFKFKTLYFYTTSYFFNITLPIDFANFKFDRGSRMFFFTIRLSSNYLKPYLNLVKLLFQVFYKPLFLKLKFKGKGYYIFKNQRNTITPQFGFSHRIYVYSYSTVVKFLTKTKVFLFGLSQRDLLTSGYSIKAMRPINIFTGRGVRFSKQLVYKKTGKVSSYR